MKFLTTSAAIVIVMASVQTTFAIAPFKTAFKEKYAAKHKSKEFQAAVKKASCNLCHVSKQKKPIQNEYGKLLNKLIPGDANARIKAAYKEGGSAAKKKETEVVLAQLAKAFDKAFETKSDGGKGPKYGELIKEGKLPVDMKKAVADFKAEQKKKATSTESAAE